MISWRPPLGINKIMRKRSCQKCASRRSQARTKQCMACIPNMAAWWRQCIRSIDDWKLSLPSHSIKLPCPIPTGWARGGKLQKTYQVTRCQQDAKGNYYLAYMYMIDWEPEGCKWCCWVDVPPPIPYSWHQKEDLIAAPMMVRGPFHRTCHQWQLVIHWLLPWQQCFIANQDQECHFTCHWMTNCHWWQVLRNGPQVSLRCVLFSMPKLSRCSSAHSLFLTSDRRFSSSTNDGQICLQLSHSKYFSCSCVS